MNKIIHKIQQIFGITKLNNDIKSVKLLLGKLLSKNLDVNNENLLDISEFKVFSQFGEDGIIQDLISKLNLKNKSFVEFGVENYEEANTRFLLENNNWKGLIIDSSKKNINFIKNQDYYWRFDIEAKCNFITKENINNIIKESNIPYNTGILSVDIDGNDYWIWDAINVIYPDVVIIEYNARFGPDRSVTIPYDKSFDRTNNKTSKIYYGASLMALCKLGRKKGYELVGTNSNGNNAFFVKKDKLINSSIKTKTPKDCYHKNSFSELLDENFEIIKNKEEEMKILNKLDLIEI